MGGNQTEKGRTKVGMITMHRVVNYGSVLQTYALQRSISDLGFECDVIDYIYPNSHHQEKDLPDSNKESLLQKIKSNVNRIVTKQKQHEQAFSRFFTDYIKLSQETYPTMQSLQQSPPRYDIYVCGSDQVWNTKYLNGDATFLLDFAPEGAKRISYAASFGDRNFDRRYAELYREHLQKFSNISVREDAGVQIVTDLTNQKAQSVLDPSFLLSLEEWSRLAVAPEYKRKYVLCYYLGYKFNPQPYADRLAKQIANQFGYDLVFIKPRPYRDKILDPAVHTVFDAGPREFLGWFADAEIVLTTSYHGTAFSINFNKPFFSIVDNAPSLDCRQKDLLEQFQLHDQILPVNTPMPDLSRLQPDYRKLNKMLAVARQRSLDFLSNSLKG